MACQTRQFGQPHVGSDVSLLDRSPLIRALCPTTDWIKTCFISARTSACPGGGARSEPEKTFGVLTVFLPFMKQPNTESNISLFLPLVSVSSNKRLNVPRRNRAASESEQTCRPPTSAPAGTSEVTAASSPAASGMSRRQSRRPAAPVRSPAVVYLHVVSSVSASGAASSPCSSLTPHLCQLVSKRLS